MFGIMSEWCKFEGMFCYIEGAPTFSIRIPHMFLLDVFMCDMPTKDAVYLTSLCF